MDEHKTTGFTMRTGVPQPPQWLLAESRTLHFDRGALVMRSDDPAKHVYLVISGRIMIFSIGENGQENKVVMVPAGGIVGEMEAIAGVDRVVYSARAFDACELVRIPLAAFVRWVRSDSQACWGLTQVLAEKLYAASLQSSQYTGSDAMQRLLSQLLQLGPGRVEYTRQELAESCSVSLRTVNRCVKKLHDDGLVGLNKGKIEISQSQMKALGEQMNRNS